MSVFSSANDAELEKGDFPMTKYVIMLDRERAVDRETHPIAEEGERAILEGVTSIDVPVRRRYSTREFSADRDSESKRYRMPREGGREEDGAIYKLTKLTTT
jgi:hypothetical protein